MKKTFKLIFITLVGALATAGFLIYLRYQQNPTQIVPFPYEFTTDAPQVKLDAPILIIGDRMGEYFGKFKEELAAVISANLAKPIKIQSMAKSGHALHRSLHELHSLTQWPQILIYQGGSEEFSESKFDLSEIKKIKTNFSRFSDDRLETLMILYPWLSRLIYEPVRRVKLSEIPERIDKITEKEYLKRLETELLLYEKQLLNLINQSKSRNTLLILSTTPINLDIPPKRVCEFTTSIDIETQILDLKKLLQDRNLKTAYSHSSKLVKQITGNPSIYYIHGQISQQLGLLDESISAFLEAGAYDCDPWRATEIHNSIIRKVAKEQQIILFDFAKMLNNEYTLNTTFLDEIYPQNLYYEKAMEQLGLVIRSILKL